MTYKVEENSLSNCPSINNKDQFDNMCLAYWRWQSYQGAGAIEDANPMNVAKNFKEYATAYEAEAVNEITATT